MDVWLEHAERCAVLLVGEQTAHVARLAAGLHARGITVACLDGPRLAQCLRTEFGIEITNHPVPRLHLRGRYRFGWVRGIENRARRAYLTTLLQTLQPAVIHINSLDPAHAALLDIPCCPPIVATVWGTDVHTIARDGSAADKAAITRLCRHAAVITADAPHMLDLTADLLDDHCRERMQLAFFGIDTTAFSGKSDGMSAAQWRRALDIPDDARVVLAPRRINPRYTPERVLEAFARMTGQHSCVVVFKLLGDNPAEEPACREALGARAIELGVDDRLRFAPPCAYRDLPGLFRTADVACFLLDRDGTPSTAFEMWAAGTPMVVGAIPHYRGILIDEENATLVDPEDPAAAAAALDRLLDDPAFAARMTAAGRAWLERHGTAEAMLDTMIGAYRHAGLRHSTVVC